MTCSPADRRISRTGVSNVFICSGVSEWSSGSAARRVAHRSFSTSTVMSDQCAGILWRLLFSGFQRSSTDPPTFRWAKASGKGLKLLGPFSIWFTPSIVLTILLGRRWWSARIALWDIRLRGKKGGVDSLSTLPDAPSLLFNFFDALEGSSCSS